MTEVQANLYEKCSRLLAEVEFQISRIESGELKRLRSHAAQLRAILIELENK